MARQCRFAEMLERCGHPPAILSLYIIITAAKRPPPATDRPPQTTTLYLSNWQQTHGETNVPGISLALLSKAIKLPGKPTESAHHPRHSTCLAEHRTKCQAQEIARLYKIFALIFSLREYRSTI